MFRPTSATSISRDSYPALGVSARKGAASAGGAASPPMHFSSHEGDNHQRAWIPAHQRPKLETDAPRADLSRPKDGFANSWIKQELKTCHALARSPSGQAASSAFLSPIKARKSRSKPKRPSSPKERKQQQKLDTLIGSQPLWPKRSNRSAKLKQRTRTRPTSPVASGKRVLHISEAKERCARLSPFAGKAVFGSSERLGLELAMLAREASFKPDPGVHQPDWSASLMGGPGGQFNLSKSKTQIEWEMWRAQQLPAPGYVDVPDQLGDNIKGGSFNMSKPKTDVEWEIYRAKQVPAPGQYSAPKALGGDVNGGKFNLAVPKSEVEWMEYRSKQVPAPGQYQPDGGFDISREISEFKGQIKQYHPKSDVESNILRSSQLPDPGSYSLPNELGNDTIGGSFNLSNPKTEVDWAVYRASFLPEAGNYNVARSFKLKTHNAAFQREQAQAEKRLRRKRAQKRLKGAIKKVSAQVRLNRGNLSLADAVVAASKVESALDANDEAEAEKPLDAADAEAEAGDDNKEDNEGHNNNTEVPRLNFDMLHAE